MLKMKKIKRNNNVIECEMTPEDSERSCVLILDIVSGKVSCELPKGYEYCINHVAMAVNWLKKNKDNLPEEKLLMWY